MKNVQLCANIFFSSFCSAQNVGSNKITKTTKIKTIKEKILYTHSHTHRK